MLGGFDADRGYILLDLTERVAEHTADMPDMDCTESYPSRKILKPVVEKQRRDRINNCLEEMRILLLKLTGNQKLRNPKMEKAEILELAVIYIGNVTRMKTHDPERWVSPAEKFYLSGFRDCLDRTEDFISDINPDARNRFLDGLQTHLQQQLRFPKQVFLSNVVDKSEDGLASKESQHNMTIDFSHSGDDLSPFSTSTLSSPEMASSPGWLSPSPENPAGFHIQPENSQTFVWRPWP
ncbi:transcription factor HES-7-like [Pelobates cultripes]|uniref:Transcription factor HES-7-like n=1 Tax=Pelobates cultripes TaxID=61616 RepID=A0AAD1VXM9_PELCU|nr:transcription factor HES-7-like [Pelobates cultripes]